MRSMNGRADVSARSRSWLAHGSRRAIQSILFLGDSLTDAGFYGARFTVTLASSGAGSRNRYALP